MATLGSVSEPTKINNLKKKIDLSLKGINNGVTYLNGSLTRKNEKIKGLIKNSATYIRKIENSNTKLLVIQKKLGELNLKKKNVNTKFTQETSNLQSNSSILKHKKIEKNLKKIQLNKSLVQKRNPIVSSTQTNQSKKSQQNSVAPKPNLLQRLINFFRHKKSPNIYFVNIHINSSNFENKNPSRNKIKSTIIPKINPNVELNNPFLKFNNIQQDKGEIINKNKNPIQTNPINSSINWVGNNPIIEAQAQVI
jgi:hypothetical protein